MSAFHGYHGLLNGNRQSDVRITRTGTLLQKEETPGLPKRPAANSTRSRLLFVFDTV